MSTFNNAYGHSPPSSHGAVESVQGTPNTALTAFSPEDVRPPKPADSRPSSAPLSSNHQDPFVTAGPRSKADQKLSATASAFQPFSYSVGPSSTTQTAQIPAVAYGSTTNLVPGTVQYLDNVVASHSSPVRVPEVTSYGRFSTDTGATRYIKVTSIYHDTDVSSSVSLSFEKLTKTGHGVTGTTKLHISNNTVYIRLTDINEAEKVYSAIKLDHPKCAVEYIPAKDFNAVVSPNSKSLTSAHEGQVMMTASYPSNTALDKKEFEESLRELLSAEGELYAWQKLLATEAGTFRMVAEFADSALVTRAIARCNNKIIGSVVVKVEPHQPDLEKIAQKENHRQNPVPVSTPTRRPADTSELSDALGQLSIHNNVHTPRFPANNPLFNTGSPNPTGIPYLAANPFGLQPTSVPYVLNSLYSASPITPFQPAFPGSLQRQPQIADSGYDAFVSPGFSPQAFSAGAFAQPGLNRLSTTPQCYNQGFGYLPQTPANSRDIAQFNRGSNRRQNAVRTPQGQMRGRQNSNQATGHHNHVDINRIEQGIDVRTTVMLRNIPNKVDQAMLKSIIDESSHGRYDFMYLRIDFSNDCNVGYAFINFVDPLDIIDFVLARSNQKWHRFKSDKVAEVSYATIQGRDCLVQKFRNSSVMLEPPHYRPKVHSHCSHCAP
ncbi:hypothetical protein ACMFMG_008430 [Clarireedia jacksonii]